MESRIERLERLEKRMDVLERENTGLKLEILCLKRETKDCQGEVTAVKSRLDSFDRTFKDRSEQESTPSTRQRPGYDEELSNLMQKIQMSSKKVGIVKTGNPIATTMELDLLDKRLATMDAKDQRLATLEQQLVDLKDRLGSLEAVQDMKRKSIFNVVLTKSMPFSNQITRLDEWNDSSYINIGDVFDPRTCSFKFPVYGFYGLDFEMEIQDGEIELFLDFGENNCLLIAKSDKNKNVISRMFIGPFYTNNHYVAVRRVSGKPKGQVCVASWLIQPI